MLSHILTGGFLAGYRTYISAGLVVITAIAAYATGDADLYHTVEAIGAGLGLAGLRAAK